jgi:DNA (cytosine-5)-methyltransferase 1
VSAGLKTRRATPVRRVAEHRPSTRVRKFRHDDLIAVDLFSGFGGLTEGIRRAGFTTIMAANHNQYKVEVHEANHPDAEHWRADLINPESSDYHSARDLPAADLLVAGVTCTNHTQANTKRAYEQGLTLFDLDDPEFDGAVTRSERDRATANCVLHYADAHHPKMILVECTTELQSWGIAVPGKRKVGDGSTYRWWLKQFGTLGYRHQVLFLNSRFFDVDQSRDRIYIVFWDKKLPAPDLEHKPMSWCGSCSTTVEAVWTWKTGIPPTGSVRYGKQYNYRCPRCRSEVIPPSGYSLRSMDLSNLGTRIGDREKPLAPATMARADRCLQKFSEFPAVLMPAKSSRGSETHPWQPMATQTSQQETALLSTGAIIAAAGNTYERPGSECRSRDLTEPLWSQTATNTTGLVTPPIALAVDNFQGAPRGADDALPTQGGSETMALLTARVLPNRTNGTSRGVSEPMETLVGNAGSGGLGILSSGVIPYRKNTTPTTHAEAMPTVTAEQIPGLLTAAGRVQCNGSIEEAKYRAYPVDKPLGTVVGSAVTQGMLFSGWYKQNGSRGTETAPHPASDPFGTLTSRDTTALLQAEWTDALADLTLEDCYFRMMFAHEVGRGCGFDVDFGDHQGTFKVWGSASNQVDGFGNAVSPQVGHWIGDRLRAVLHRESVAA